MKMTIPIVWQEAEGTSLIGAGSPVVDDSCRESKRSFGITPNIQHCLSGKWSSTMRLGYPEKTAKKNTGVCKNTSFQKVVLEFSGLAFEFSLHVHHLLCQAQPGLKMRKSISQICGCHFTLALRTNHQWLLTDLQGFTESTPTRSCVQKWCRTLKKNWGHHHFHIKMPLSSIISHIFSPWKWTKLCGLHSIGLPGNMKVATSERWSDLYCCGHMDGYVESTHVTSYA